MAAASSSSKAPTSKRKATTSAATATSAGGKSKKAKPSSSSSDDASIPLGKALASTEKRIRDGAVRSLRAYLAANGAHTIGELELQKLWKGLFYCFWMSDKPLIQQRLANDLAQLVLVHPSTSTTSSTSEGAMTERAMAGLKFLETFWDTLVTEWSGLDKHRIDKFYLLVRRFVASGFQLLAEEKWNAEAVIQFQRILGKFDAGVLSTNNPKVPDSLSYHLSDIYLDELEKDDAGKSEEDEEEEGDETNTGTEFHSFADESTFAHDDDDDESEPSLAPSDSDPEDDDARDVRYPLLLALSSVPTPTPNKDVEDDEDLDETDVDVALVLRKAIFQALFTAASRKDATEARRRLLYQLWRDEQDRL
ncbi:hypothetical protein [Sporisorium scitamineum]|uniref:Uncharacterized protein n=1 Tax=Sporisorium scitamineum TaxID=49012 RepID=A0A0F7S0Y7_9BASI|nr:hypothetical protein [Sporisorium scitamineum]